MTLSSPIPKLNIPHVAQAGQHLAGQGRLADFTRLLAECHDADAASAPLTWSIDAYLKEGATGPLQPWLHLRVDTCLPQICQRCLLPTASAVQVDRHFRFVPNEAIAAEQDEDAEEDVLVSSRDFDLGELIEDEVLMALPLIARHAECPVTPKLSVADADFDAAPGRPNPFAALNQLKAPKDPD